MCPHERILSCSLASPCTRLSRAQSTIKGSDFHRGVCLPMDGPFGQHTRLDVKTTMDLPGSSDASVATRAVPLDPAGLPVALPVTATFPWPSTYSSVSASGPLSRGSSGFTCVTARMSPCLRLAHVVTSMCPRLGSRWAGLALAGAGIAPAGSAGLCLAHRRSLRYRPLPDRHIVRIADRR